MCRSVTFRKHYKNTTKLNIGDPFPTNVKEGVWEELLKVILDSTLELPSITCNTHINIFESYIILKLAQPYSAFTIIMINFHAEVQSVQREMELGLVQGKQSYAES